MDKNDYIVRTMIRKEIDIAIDWAAEEGWNPGCHDAECYYRADPNGFFIGMLNEEPIATISAVRYDASFGFIGFYIVKPQFRGNGYGLRIWRSGLKYLEGQNVGLDGVLTQQKNYEKSLFKLAYRNLRYEGIGGGNPTESRDIVQLSSFPFELIRSYDQTFFPADRSAFLNCWINQPKCHALGIRHNGKLAGYGVLRLCRNGYKIGPLFADSSELAELLFLELKSQVKPGDPIFLDVPEVNQRATALAERYGMDISFETARMYNKEFPDINLTHTFGVTSFEVG